MKPVIARVQALVFAPAGEWRVIARERANAARLFGNYITILAAIPALAHFIGACAIGRYQSVVSGLTAMIIGYVGSLATVYAVAVVIDILAPRFQAERGFPDALKLSAYAHTPLWLAGVFLLIPGLSFLTVLGLYGFTLLRLGLPPLMRAPGEQALPYAAAATLGALVFAVAVGFLQAAVFIPA